ncbi:hypothetical protein PVAND_008022 [Polypedilum vanderplanki]|uniref:Uncharacterized protein n=1 Tax=Polypedilum vanderplanki TaxID=319348 RepID=A0A9J6C8E7_POLVA|nr:hypothetical protein PVAND_008022 [Polypedilum vanderplanki]
MEKWRGKVAIVTGASSGIGAAIVRDLAKNGITVIGLARRVQKIREQTKDFPENYANVHAFYCDVSKIESIKEAFKLIEERFGVINILVNNAGIGKKTSILVDDEETDGKISQVIDTNFTGLVHVTRHAYMLMKKSEDYGMVVNINSVAGHKVSFPYYGVPETNVYNGSKFAVTATTEYLRHELIQMKDKKVRVSSVSPGVVDTSFFHSSQMLPDNIEMRDVAPVLNPSDIADAVMYLLQVPYHVNITEMTKVFAVFTRTSSEIGAEIVKDIAKNGINVIGLAQRSEKFKESIGAKVNDYNCVVSNLDSKKAVFKWIKDKLLLTFLFTYWRAAIYQHACRKDFCSEVEQVINTNLIG